MPDEQTQTSVTYSRLSIGLHWFMLLLLVVVYALIELRELYPRGSEIREAFKAWHFTAGLTVFGLVLVRLLVRVSTSGPSRPSTALEWLGAAMHLALYGLMVLMPLIGWMVLSASGKPIPFFGVQLPALISTDKILADQLKEIHEVVGVAGYWLVGLHASAALLHHFVLRDDTLRRMAPVLRKP